MIDLQTIHEAVQRLAGKVHRTPILTSSAIDRMAGRRVFFKCENLQKGGAFKYRGALNAVLQLSPAEAARGVVTHSSGNHAQAVALAARLRGVPAHLVMPENSLPVKIRAVRGYGGTVHLCAPNLQARETTAQRVIAETGGTFVHPYDHPHIIAGQASVGCEILEQVPDLDAIIVPLGGGGLLSGVTLAARALRPALPVFGVEPLGADDAARSRAAGRLIPQRDPQTIADGLRTSLGQHTWPVIRDHVTDIWTVEEAEIIHAMRTIWERLKLVIEPSAAVGLAALLTDRIHQGTDLQRVAVVLSGGNADLDQLPFAAP